MLYLKKLSKNSLFYLLIGVCISSYSFGQDWKHKDYDWGEIYTEESLNEDLKEEGAVFLKYHNYFELDDDYNNPNNLYFVKHTIIYINSDKAIERNNKIYINQQSESNGQEIKTRTINKNGDITLLDESNIKRGVDEESGQEYSYYAVEGLEVGSILESIAKIETSPSYYGTMVNLQQSYPIQDFKFEYAYPEFLGFKFKVYNSNLEGKSTEEEEQTVYTLEAEYIEKILSEPMSHRNANKGYLLYKLDKNYSKNMNDINGFGYFNEIIGNRIFYKELSKSSEKKLKKLLAEIDLSDANTDLEKITKIESYLKNNFAYVENNSTSVLETMDQILVNKAYNFFGVAQIYNYMFREIGLDCGIVATCDKSEVQFDKTFENYLFLGNQFITTLDEKVIIDPADKFSRINYIDPMYLGHEGLFVKKKTIGGVETAIGKVKTIPSNDAMDNLIRAEININIAPNFDDLTIDINKEYHGQVAKNTQPIFPLLEQDELDEFYKYAVYAYTDHVKSATLEFTNTEQDAFPLKPLIADFEIESNNFFEKGGNSYFLKLGELIGPQSQLYYDEEKERVNDVFSQYPRKYEYKLSFNIPEGFEAQNLDDINIEIKSEYEDHDFFFHSEYEQVGDKVTVTINELYDSSTYPASTFESYRKVINAAADFNKVKILFKG